MQWTGTGPGADRTAGTARKGGNTGPRRSAALIAAVGAAAAVGAYLLFPVTPPVDRNVTGDEGVAERVLAELPYGSAVGVSVLVQEDGDTRTVRMGTRGDGRPVEEATRFETGSLQKVVTARLLAQMVADGEVELDTTLGEIWPDTVFADPAAADTTLESLATHTSGLPRLPFGADESFSWSFPSAFFFKTDPYRASGDPVRAVASLRSGGAAPDAPYTYSNYGYAVLGWSLAHAAGTDYRTAVTERVLEPLGMDATVVHGPDDAPDPPENTALPHRAASSPAVQWGAGYYAPAGVGTWSTPEDLNRLLTAEQDGSSPVAELTHEPREVDGGVAPDEHDERAGLAWVLWNVDGTEVAWHNGGTSGSRTFMAHTGDGRSVVVMADTAKAPVERIGFTLLGLESPAFTDRGGAVDTAMDYLPAAVGAFLALVLPGLSLLHLAWARAPKTPLMRLKAVAELAVSGAVWGWSFILGDWGIVPPVVWALGGGLLTAAIATAGYRWRTWTTPPTGTVQPARWYSWISPVASFGIAALLLWGTATAIGQMP